MCTSELFSIISSNNTDLFKELERPLLAHQFSTEGYDVFLMLTDNFIVLCDNVQSKMPTHYLRLTFSVKFETIYKTNSLAGQQQLDFKRPLGVKLEKEESFQIFTFYCQYSHIIELWMRELERKINQRNFHKLFKAKKKIGKGTFATVYLAENLKNNKMVSVKAFSKEKQYSGDKGRESLENQINLMRSFNHSNIMRLQSVFETENSIYVILEYLEGVQLQDILKDSKPLTLEEKCEIIKSILKGLEYLSENRIIHRDLKPENIMFRKQNSTDAVICDFGLATKADAEKYLFIRCGTPGFVSPQIINIKDMSSKSDPISDVFSAGLIFHYLMLGKSIFPGKRYNDILSQNKACEFDFTHETYHDISPVAMDLMKRMLEKDPTKRISAKKALQHIYFNMGFSKMDIQETTDKRIPFQGIRYNAYIQQIKSPQETLSMFESKRTRFSYVTNNNQPRQLQEYEILF